MNPLATLSLSCTHTCQANAPVPMQHPMNALLPLCAPASPPPWVVLPCLPAWMWPCGPMDIGAALLRIMDIEPRKLKPIESTGRNDMALVLMG